LDGMCLSRLLQVPRSCMIGAGPALGRLHSRVSSLTPNPVANPASSARLISSQYWWALVPEPRWPMLAVGVRRGTMHGTIRRSTIIGEILDLNCGQPPLRPIGVWIASVEGLCISNGVFMFQSLGTARNRVCPAE
jgi:hypothetical protein